MEAGYPVYVDPLPTLADGLAVPKVGPSALKTAIGNVDRTVLVRLVFVYMSILGSLLFYTCIQ